MDMLQCMAFKDVLLSRPQEENIDEVVKGYTSMKCLLDEQDGSKLKKWQPLRKMCTVHGVNMYIVPKNI